MLKIDGSQGEGGGQILRSCFTMAGMTGKAIHMVNIRAGRKKPGLLRQHLTAVRAVAGICNGRLEGDFLGSTEVKLYPQELMGGDFHFTIGSAGSAMLVLQTILPLLMALEEPTCVILEGGTHNPFAPTFHYLDRIYLPLLKRMGVDIEMTLLRPGFYPAGGGKVEVRVGPSELRPIELLSRGSVERIQTRAIVSGIPKSIAYRELRILSKHFAMDRDDSQAIEVEQPMGPGNCVWATVQCQHAVEMFVQFGTRGRRAESVAGGVIQAVEGWLEQDVPVGSHLADQLMLPMVLAGGGRYRCGPLTQHSKTNMTILQMFTRLQIAVEECDNSHVVTVG